MTDAAAHAAELDERRLQVVTEQAVGLRWQVGLTALVVAAIAWPAVPAAWVLAWLVLVIVSREWRAAALQRLQADTARPIAERLRATTRWNLVIGACNGSAASFMLWLDPTLDAVLTMILVSWGAGAVSTSSTVMPAFLAYAALLFVPTALMWAVQGSWLGAGVATLVLMFLSVQTKFARRNLQIFEESFRIRLENEALARRLAAEQAALAEARDLAVKANLEKSRFLAAASHDLRQPLQAVMLNSGELARLPLAGDAQAIVRDVTQSAEQLRSMLDGLLDVSKLDAGVVVAQPRAFELARLLESLAQGLRAPAAAKGVTLDWQAPAGAWLHSDPVLLRRMLSNLIDNAIKFSPAGGRIELHAACADGEAEIVVRDQGPGIAQTDQERIFEDLVQLPGAPAGGHGLGLGIVRRLATLLDIRLGVESAPGRGSSFRLRLPLAAAPGTADGAQATAAGLAGRSVLVLDDDAMVRGAYVNALGGLGCSVHAAADIAGAEAQARRHRPQAAVIDCRLANGEDGFAALQRLREEQPGLAAVMVSAHADASTLERARQHAIALLNKPVDAATLSAALLAALAGRAAHAP